jgi:hypothetical protein
MHSIFSKLIVNEEGFHFPEDGIDNTLVTNIGFNDIPEPEQVGLAPEKVIQAYENFSNCQFILLNKANEPLQIVCMMPGQSVTELYIFRLISILNQLPSVRFSLYVHPAMINKVIGICNEHIRVISFPAHEKITIHTHMVLTYGLRTIHFLRTGFPAFILGPNGLGGLVTPGNLQFLFSTRFMGRPGGSLYERIPLEMVAHELGMFKDVQDVDRFLKEIQMIAHAFPIKSLSEEKRIQQAYIHQMTKVYLDEEARENLIPKLYSNMNLKKSGSTFMIWRTSLHDTICSLENEDAAFLKDMDGTHTCRFIKEKHGIADDVFWETIDILLQKGIITVNL